MLFASNVSDLYCFPFRSFRFLLPRQNPLFGKFETKDSLETDGLWDVYNKFAMGNCGESAGDKHQITRKDMDDHAIESYQRAERAWKAGAFNAEIAPVTIKGRKGDTIVKEDEEYKKVIFEKIPTLPGAFKRPDGKITAANSSNLNDGASALILMSAAKAAELGVKPLAKVICEHYVPSVTIPRAYISPFNHQLTPMLVSNPSTSPPPRPLPFLRPSRRLA